MPRSPTPGRRLTRSVLTGLVGLVLALTFSGCLGSSSSSSSGGSTELVVTVKRSILGQPPSVDRYYLYCASADGQSTALVDVCHRLDAFRNQYLGTPNETLKSAGPAQEELIIRGRVDGAPVSLAYAGGASPQYLDWMRLLAKLHQV